MDEDFIEVGDDELFQGDEHLKISSPPKIEEKTEEEEKDTDDEDSEEETLEVDDSLLERDESSDEEDEDKEEEEEEVVEDKPKKKVKKAKKVKEEKVEESDDSDDDEEDVEYNNEFSAFGGTLKEKGFFPDLGEDALQEVQDEDDLSDLLAKQMNTTFNGWKDAYKQNLVNNLMKEGYISEQQVKSQSLKSYTEDDIRDSLDVAKDVITKYYKRIGMPDKEIKRTIDSREDLEESAIELNKLNQEMDQKEQAGIAEKLKAQEEQVLAQREQFNDTLKKNTFEYSEFIPGRKLKSKDKEEVFKNIEPTLNKINSDLSKYAPLLSYLDKYGFLEGKFDKLIKEGKSRSVSELERILRDKKRGTSGSTGKRKSGVLDIDDSNIPKIY